MANEVCKIFHVFFYYNDNDDYHYHNYYHNHIDTSIVHFDYQWEYSTCTVQCHWGCASYDYTPLTVHNDKCIGWNKAHAHNSKYNREWITSKNIKKGKTLQWCHNGCHVIANHQLHHCLLNRLFRCRSKKTPKLCVIGVCKFPAQMTRNAKNVSIWWFHHEKGKAQKHMNSNIPNNLTCMMWV